MERIITVGIDAGDVRGSDNRAIQLAVDALGAAGGMVEILPGRYTCYDAVRLSGGVRLRGSGAETVLVNCQGFCSALAIDADYGQYKVTPADASGFAVGMRIYVGDDRSGGWTDSTASIERIEDGVLHIDRHLMMDYAMSRNATVSNAGALISVIDATDIAVENLAIDGQRTTHQQAGGCRVGAIYMNHVSRVRLADLVVRDFAGDGISFQITRDVSVSNVSVTGCSNYGIHPGTGSAGVRMNDCQFDDNDVGGFFLCWRVQEGRFERLRCRGNGQFGISIGHKDTDNEFADCQLVGNGKYALVFRQETETNGAHRNTWRNCQFAGSETAVYVPGHTYENVFDHCAIGQEGTEAMVLLPDVRRFAFRACAWTGSIRDESGPDAGHQGLAKNG